MEPKEPKDKDKLPGGPAEKEKEVSAKLRLQSFFGFTRIPFAKNARASKMFLSASQEELSKGLAFYLEIKGIAVVSGPVGAGKSITLRRFKENLPANRYTPFYFWNVRNTPLGFFRMMCRGLNLPVGQHKADLLDQIHGLLGQFEEQEGRHPILILDNCENLSVDILEHLRLMTSHDMEAEDRFSMVLVGAEKLLDTINNPFSLSFKQRINFLHHLTGFNVNDAKAYVQYHLTNAEGPRDLFDEEAIMLIFQVSRGYPRIINQICTHALIKAAIREKDRITKSFLQNQVLKQALFIYQSPNDNG